MTGMTNGGGGGGGVNLHVIGGTTQPAEARENTVWVNTEDTITSWVIQYEEPEEPEDGMVWIKSQSTANNILNIAKRGMVKVGIGTVKQYDGTEEAWNTMTGQVYVGGEWVDLELYLTQGNQFNEKYEWTMRGSGCVVNTESSSNYFELIRTNGSSAYSSPAIDLTNIDTVRFHLSATGSASLNFFGISVSQTVATKESENPYTVSFTNATVKTLFNENTTAEQDADLDVSSLEGEFFVNICSSASQRTGHTYVNSIQLI